MSTTARLPAVRPDTAPSAAPSRERQIANEHIFDEIPGNKGPRVITDRGAVAHVVRPPGSHRLRPREHMVAVMLAASPGIRVSFDDQRVHEYDGDAGTISVMPANSERKVTWSSTCEKVIVTMPPQRLLELSAHEFGAGRAVLQPPPFGLIDLRALHLAEMLKAELAREVPSKIYIESLITIFGVHIVRNYTGADSLPPRRKSGGGLSIAVPSEFASYWTRGLPARSRSASLRPSLVFRHAISSRHSRRPSASLRTNMFFGCASILLKNSS